MEELEKDMKPRLIGETYMKYPTETSRQKYRYGLYECQYCGGEWECRTTNIDNNITKSCGCLVGKNTTHGLKSNRFYATWNNIFKRCTNPKNKAYKDYGGRGITVCEEWLDVRNFIAWAESTYPNIEGYTLDRIDNDKGYNPDNCRWADRITQVLNRRIMKNNTSGYVGIYWHKRGKKWRASISVNNKLIYLGLFPTVQEAVLARDNYIIENKLPHKLSILNKTPKG